MSLVPYLLNGLLDDVPYPRHGSVFDQNFGLGLMNDDLFHPHSLAAPLVAGYLRPWRHQPPRHSGVSNIQNDKDGFKVNLDVQQFKPEEINVKMVDDFVVIEAKHEERKDDHGYISREFQRRYKIPEDVDPNTVVSKLSSDGVLSIEAPKKAIELPSKERVVPIVHTNARAVTAKSQGKGKDGKKETTPEKMDQ